ncbi:MAG: glutaredoxin domain-containing protein [Gemmatimonas sp.]
MPRHVLDESRIHPAVRERVAAHHRDVVDEVEAVVRAHAVVVVGMRANPYPRKACQLLQRAGIAHHYLEYGGYLSEWRRRNALKMWSGWPTFPMVFVQGLLVGGYDDLKALHDSGELARMLKG